MWAHATPSGLRPPQASSDVTPRVFLCAGVVEIDTLTMCLRMGRSIRTTHLADPLPEGTDHIERRLQAGGQDVPPHTKGRPPLPQRRQDQRFLARKVAIPSLNQCGIALPTRIDPSSQHGPVPIDRAPSAASLPCKSINRQELLPLRHPIHRLQLLGVPRVHGGQQLAVHVGPNHVSHGDLVGTSLRLAGLENDQLQADRIKHFDFTADLAPPLHYCQGDRSGPLPVLNMRISLNDEPDRLVRLRVLQKCADGPTREPRFSIQPAGFLETNVSKLERQQFLHWR